MTAQGTKRYLHTAGFTDYFATLKQNPTMLLLLPKVIHNLTLKHSKPLVDFIGLGKFFDLLGIGLNLIFKDEKPKDRSWYSNYFLFGTWINALKFLRPTPNFPLFTTHFWGGVVGALIQGFDDCPAQERLGGKYPKTAAAIGFANGVMCCFLQSACISLFNSCLPLPKEVNFSLGFVATWAMSSKLMCKIEQFAFNLMEKYMPGKPEHTKTTEQSPKAPKEHVPTPGCCCSKPQITNPDQPASTKHVDALHNRGAAALPAIPAR